MSQKAVAYYRVSTQRQGRSGLGLEAQEYAVQGFCQSRGFELLESFTEVESGRKSDRPELHQAIALAQSKGAVLLIAKLDRLARNVFFVSQLMDAKIKFIACDMPEANEMTVQIMAVMAEQEARATSQRVKDALKAAKARGVVLGKPENFTEDVREMGRQESARKAREAYALVVGYMQTLREKKLSFEAIAKKLNKEGHRTRQNRHFQPMTVKRVLDRS